MGATPSVDSLSPDAYPKMAKATLKLAAMRQIRAHLGRSELGVLIVTRGIPDELPALLDPGLCYMRRPFRVYQSGQYSPGKPAANGARTDLYAAFKSASVIA